MVESSSLWIFGTTSVQERAKALQTQLTRGFESKARGDDQEAWF